MVWRLGTWETVRAASRATSDPVCDVGAGFAALQPDLGERVVEIGAEESGIALETHARYGRVGHPAQLSIGDCFAYACAQAQGAPLLCKAKGFAMIDIETA